MYKREVKNMLYYLRLIIGILTAAGLGACSTISSSVTRTSTPFPHLHQQNATIALFSFDNYTDTPQAGKRAANLVDGILSTKGYTTHSHINDETMTFTQKHALAKSIKARYFITGGISEWRYKTGIDGEPAVSLTMKLIDTKSGRTLWSSAASSSNWGNASIGTTAQEILESILR
jgi:TolB-like protein